MSLFSIIFASILGVVIIFGYLMNLSKLDIGEALICFAMSIVSITIYLLMLLVSLIFKFIEKQKLKKAKQINKTKTVLKKDLFFPFAIIFVITIICTLIDFTIYKVGDQLKMNNLKKTLDNSYLIVRISYTGLENLFHDKYEYYLVKNDNTISKYTSEQIEKAFNKDLDILNIYSDTETSYYFTELKYSSDGDFGKINKDFINSLHGNNYRLFYSKQTKHSENLSENDKIIMQNIASIIHNGDIKNYTSKSGNVFGLTYFTMVKNKNINLYLIEWKNELYLYKNNELIKIMKELDNGELDFYYFTK